jgi:hypothetical protein
MTTTDASTRSANANGWTRPSRRRGNFDYRSVVSSYQFDVRDAYVDKMYFGLPLLGAYFYSSFVDSEGNTLAPMRKCTAEMSTGLQMQTNVGRDAIEVEQDAFLRSQRGVGIRWSWESDDAFALRAAATPFGDSVDIRVSNDAIAWREGDMVDVEGRLLGGYQWYTPTRDEGGGNYYASAMFRAKGVVLGREVDGIIGFDELYGPQGQVFQTGPMFNAIELAWVSFANCYEDGEFEVGACCLGADHWGFSVIVDHDGERIAVTDIEADVRLTDSLYVAEATYHLPGEDWRFVAAERAEMRSLAAAREDKYHGQGGVIRRIGDERVPLLSRAWIESFPLNGVTRTR